jgi:hypothetical protein
VSAAAPTITQAPTTTTDVEGTNSDELSGWYCIKTDPWPCPAEGCSFVAKHLTAVHKIVVWPSLDDRDLLTNARNAREVGRNPKIVEYERSMGPAVTFDAWVSAGKPVHSVRSERPDGYDDLPRL